MPRVTVAIPLYNAEKTIGATLQSVLAQTFLDFEIIVIDDGSNDAGSKVVASYGDERIRLHWQANAGVSATRNRAVELSRGEFVAFLDADDLWRPRHLEYLISLAEKFPAAGLLGNRFMACSRSSASPGPLPSTETQKAVTFELLKDYFTTWARGKPPFHTSSSMVRRDAALRAGGFPVGYHRGEDLAFFIRMAMLAPVAVTSYVGCLYVRAGTGLTSNPVLEPDIAMQTISGLLTLAPDTESEKTRLALREFYNKLAIAHALDCLLYGKKAEARRFLALSASTRWQRSRWWLARLFCAYHPALAAVMSLAERHRQFAGRTQ